MHNLVRETNHFISHNAGVFNRTFKVIEIIPIELNNPETHYKITYFKWVSFLFFLCLAQS